MTAPYLEKLRALKAQKRAPRVPSKPSKHVLVAEMAADTTRDARFEGFERARGRGFSDSGSLEPRAADGGFEGFEGTRCGAFAGSQGALEGRCPDLVPPSRWQQAVEDGRRFLAQWGEQAEALGWTPEDLFGLHQPPDKPHPSYNRLSRYDELGLIWLLAGRPVIALTAAGAAIATPTGNTTTYYRRGVAPAADEHLAIPTFLQVANRKVPLDRQCPLGPAARATPSTIPNDQERTNARP